MKKKRIGILRKALTIMTMVAMLFTMGTGAITAAITQDSTGSITVDNLDTGTEVNAYQVMDVNVENGAPVEPVFTWSDEVVNWITANYPTYIDTANDNAVTTVFQELQSQSDQVTGFYEKLAAEIKKTGSSIPIAVSYNQSAGENGTVKFADVMMGSYLLTAKGGVKVYSPTGANIIPISSNGEWNVADTVISMKGTDPAIEKTVTNSGDGTVSIGDTVSYQLDALVPDYPQDAVAMMFTVGDKLSEGLSIDASTIRVYKDKDGAIGELVAASNYQLEANGNSTLLTPYTFQITFHADFIKNNVGEKLYITYDAVINEKALTIDSLKNEAYLGYNNDPYDSNSYKENTTEAIVFTYGIGVIKVDKDSNTPLKGAEFMLSKAGTELKFTKNAAGVYVFDKINGSTKLKVDESGTLMLQGLDEDTYVLKETKAPEGGYVLPSGAITIAIKEAGPKDGVLAEGDVKVTTSGSSQIDSNLTLSGNKVTITVKNTKGGTFELPVTGGTGTIMFTIGGLILMGGACALFLKNRKVKQH